MGFGCNGDPRLTLESFVGGTADIPLPWLREGLHRFSSEPGRQWVPTLPEIRTSCALAIRRHRDEARGEPPQASVAQVELGPWHVEHAIGYAAKHAPLGVGQMHRIEGPARRQIASGAATTAPESLQDALRVDHVGEGADVARGAFAIAEVGHYVPVWNTARKGDALNGRLLALMLAQRLSGHDALWPEYDGLTHRRLAAAMERHRAAGGECGWWDDHCAGWERRAA